MIMEIEKGCSSPEKRYWSAYTRVENRRKQHWFVLLFFSLKQVKMSSEASENDYKKNENKTTWLESVFGCIKPVLNLIGRVDLEENKKDNWEIPFEIISGICY